jgi:hypothetical protein
LLSGDCAEIRGYSGRSSQARSHARVTEPQSSLVEAAGLKSFVLVSTTLYDLLAKAAKDGSTPRMINKMTSMLHYLNRLGELEVLAALARRTILRAARTRPDMTKSEKEIKKKKGEPSAGPHFA